jgi:hypothetical protein
VHVQVDVIIVLSTYVIGKPIYHINLTFVVSIRVHIQIGPPSGGKKAQIQVGGYRGRLFQGSELSRDSYDYPVRWLRLRKDGVETTSHVEHALTEAADAHDGARGLSHGQFYLFCKEYWWYETKK